MYINPFWAGVSATVLAELLGFVLFTIVVAVKNK